MKKVSKFYLSRQRKPKDLAKQMQEIAIEDERKKLKKIVSQRKQKWKQAMVATQLRLPNFNHLRKQYFEFSIIPCNASQQPFVTQKDKRKLANSDRAYSSTPNLKAGTISTTTNLRDDVANPKILNQMFNEYDRLIDEQSPASKLKLKKELNQKNYLPQCTTKKNLSTFDKNYFQQFTTHKFNIDKTNDYHSITDLLTRKCITDRKNSGLRPSQDSLIEQNPKDKSTKTRNVSGKSKIFGLKKIKRLNSTQESTGNDEGQSFDCSILDRTLNSQKIRNSDNLRNSKKTIQTKSRITTNRRYQSRVNFAKNINSIEY